MSRAADTSVVVPALLKTHPAHQRCAAALNETSAAVAHVIAESYSVLTRLPHPVRISPGLAAAAMAHSLPRKTVALGADDYALLPARLAQAGLSGGSVYDALIALGAAAHALELLTVDARAARTYRLLGVEFELLT